MHFEAYGFTASASIEAYFTVSISDETTSLSPLYQWTIGTILNVLDFTPVNRVIWWKNVLEGLFYENKFYTHTWIGESYYLSFASASIYYVESFFTKGTDISDKADPDTLSTSWFDTQHAGIEDNTWTWDDYYLQIFAIDYLPQKLQNLVGENEYYIKQLF